MPDRWFSGHAATPQPAPDPATGALQRFETRQLRRWLQRRRWLDLGLALTAIPSAMVIAPTAEAQLSAGILAVSAAMLFFVIRRSRDIALMREALRAGDARFEGRGISVGAWHRGEPLPAWAVRNSGKAGTP